MSTRHQRLTSPVPRHHFRQHQCRQKPLRSTNGSPCFDSVSFFRTNTPTLSVAVERPIFPCSDILTAYLSASTSSIYTSSISRTTTISSIRVSMQFTSIPSCLSLTALGVWVFHPAALAAARIFCLVLFSINGLDWVGLGGIGIQGAHVSSHGKGTRVDATLSAPSSR